MTYRLLVSDDLRDFIRHLPPVLKKKIRVVLKEIVNDPSCGKALVEELAGLYSYKIGRIRVIYQVMRDSITLIAVGPRKTVYQKAALEIKRRPR